MSYARRRCSLPVGLVFLMLLVVRSGMAAELTPGNVLVSVGVAYDSTLREYAPNGDLVQSVVVPYPDPPRPSSEILHDIAVTPTGQVAIYNGTFDPYMTRWTPGTGDWSHDTYTGWDTGGLAGYGGIAAWQNYVYATDMLTSGEPPNDKGLIRFNTADGTATRYFDYTEFIDVTLGFDGLLYAMRTDEHGVYVISPETMTVQRSFQVVAACRGLAVDAAGNIFGASLDGNLYEFNWYGSILNAINPNVGGLFDVDLDANGALVAGTLAGWVVNSDETLQSFSTFRATYYIPTFVSFTTPVPEPTSAIAVFLGVLALRRRGERMGHYVSGARAWS